MPALLTFSGFLAQTNPCSLPFAELFKRRPDHTPALDDAVPANSDVSQISSDDAVVHHYGLIRDRKAC